MCPDVPPKCGMLDTAQVFFVSVSIRVESKPLMLQKFDCLCGSCPCCCPDERCRGCSWNCKKYNKLTKSVLPHKSVSINYRKNKNKNNTKTTQTTQECKIDKHFYSTQNKSLPEVRYNHGERRQYHMHFF